MAPLANMPGENFVVECMLLLGVSFVFVVLRCLARIDAIGLRKLSPDDWGMKVAVVSNT
jgi:hypothetical protein